MKTLSGTLVAAVAAPAPAVVTRAGSGSLDLIQIACNSEKSRMRRVNVVAA